jgi:plasmid stabilization system protein ParE
MAFRISITAKAKRDLDEIITWLLSKAAKDTAWRWFKGLREAIASLADSPERCPLAPENSGFPFEVRQLLYGRRYDRYRILFTIQGEMVSVLHVRHGRRQRAKR